MREHSSQAQKCLQNLRDNQWEFHLRAFATSLVEDGYTDRTVQVKSRSLARLGRWLQTTKLSITDLNERLLEAFPKGKHGERRGDLRTLKQFLDHLRRQKVVPPPNLPCDRSPLAHVLGRYETHLCTERGLVAPTIQEYQFFVRKFLLERFHCRPLLLKAVKASDISDFILWHSPSMATRRAQTMTSAFRSFFRFLFQKGELQVDLAASVPTVANLAAVHCAQVPDSKGSQTCAQGLRPPHLGWSPRLRHSSSSRPFGPSRRGSDCSPARGHQLESR